MSIEDRPARGRGRVLALVLLAIFAAIVLLGIYEVPRHDGRVAGALFIVMLPAAGICWCIWQLLPTAVQ